MKFNKLFLVSSVLIFSIIFLNCSSKESGLKPRVIVTTDINNGPGDPDDRQSLCHLLFYANELNIRGIIPDRFSKTGTEACTIVLDLYEKDFNNPNTKYKEYGYPTVDYFRNYALVSEKESAIQRIINEAKIEGQGPLWILVWGNMGVLNDVLKTTPEIANKIRIITIATFLRAKENGGDGNIKNWNSWGRQEVYDNFPKLWWLESEWTYNGMFPGKEAVDLKETLAKNAGELGKHIKDVIGTVEWADNFRAGDTPTVLYMIDPNHDLNDPTQASWAGKYNKPFPEERPYFWTGITGKHEWDAENPVNTWENASKIYELRVNTLLNRRPDMYDALINKVFDLYNVNSEK